MESMLRMAKNNASDKDSIDISKLDVGENFYVGIDLEEAINNPHSNYDIVMRDGDKLIIPEYNGTVKINGAVMYPNTISYTGGLHQRIVVECVHCEVQRMEGEEPTKPSEVSSGKLFVTIHRVYEC